MATRGRQPRKQLLTARPKPPKTFSTEEAKIFESVVKDLETQKTLVFTDSKSIELYAEMRALQNRLRRELAASDLIFGARANPLLSQVNSIDKSLMALLSKLGLTASHRKHTNASIDDEDANWEL